jgi:cell division septal protein FtsQ
VFDGKSGVGALKRSLKESERKDYLMNNGTMKIWGYKLSRKNKTVKKKNKKNSGKWPQLGPFVPYAITLLAVLSVLALCGIFLRYYFLNSETFRVKHILVSKSSLTNFRDGEEMLDKMYLGRNIFSVLPSQVEVLIRSDYPHLDMIRVRRVFPDTIEVDLVPRESFACIESAGGVVVDKSGMILSVGKIPENLVIVKGVNFFLSRPQPGVVLKDKGLDDALEVIGAMLNKAKIKRGYLELVDVSDRKNMWVTVKGVPVNLGSGDMRGKINTLGDILSDPKIDLGGIRYIDLRFKDPVYSYKRT